MRKIEEAAADYVRSPDLDPFHSYADIFIAGARYVLDAMTSNEARESLIRSLGIVFSSRDEISTAIAAVRKEIEG